MESRRSKGPQIYTIQNGLRNYICQLSDYMGEPASNINTDQYYRGRMYCFISSDEGSFIFCESYQIFWFFTQASRRYPDGTVEYFRKSSNSLQRQLSCDTTCSFSTNETLHKSNHDQVSSLPYFCCEWWSRDQICWHQGTACVYFYKATRFWAVCVSTIQSNSW